jgi:transketolase
MTNEDLAQLKTIARRVREHIIRMATAGGCFIGASLSCADLIVYLYSHVLNITPDNLADPDRDYLFLSKGHDVPALYGTFVELGLLERTRLANHLKRMTPSIGIPTAIFPASSFTPAPWVTCCPWRSG